MALSSEIRRIPSGRPRIAVYSLEQHPLEENDCSGEKRTVTSFSEIMTLSPTAYSGVPYAPNCTS